MSKKLNELEKAEIYADTITLVTALFSGGYEYSPKDVIMEIYQSLKKLKEDSK